MSSKCKAHRFPRSAVDEQSLIAGLKVNDARRNEYHERRKSSAAAIFKAQYFELDRGLQEAFNYVAPANSNATTFSVALATLIRNAATLYELLSRWLYLELFEVPTDSRLSINDYLSLDVFTRLSEMTVLPLTLYDTFDAPQIYEPFVSLQCWDQTSPIIPGQVPKWWSASNKLKHSNDGLSEFGNLENAVSAIAADFIYLHVVFGPGLVYGYDVSPDGMLYNVMSSHLFRPTLQRR